MVRIAVVGSANTDLVARLERLPGRGETLMADKYLQVGGGKGANQAIAARRMGAEVVFVGAVGKDAYGKATRDALAAEGIDVSHLYEKDTHSGVALIFVEEGTGENMIAVAAGANYALEPKDIQAAAKAIKSADMVLVQMEIRPETLEEAMKTAKKSSIPVILNPAPFHNAELVTSLFRYVEHLTPNVHELKLLAGGDDVDAAIAKVLASGPGAVFVTLGADGAALYTADGETRVDAFDVEPVDTVGAGDAFNGALAVLLAEGESPEMALTGAVAAGAVAVTREGAQPSQPTREEVEKLRASRKG